eukprot:6770327-Ditylum_brightwellii.AAC.1
MINMMSKGIYQALAEKPINDESVHLVNENTTMRAELSDLRNIIAKLDPQVNHMQQPPPTYHQQFQVPPQGPPPTCAQQPSYIWNGQNWTMTPPMPFQNLTNLP